MPKKVCEHMESIASDIRPNHSIYGCNQQSWVEEIKKGKFSTDYFCGYSGEDSEKFIRDEKGNILTYFSDIPRLDYHRIKSKVEKCNCENVEDLKQRIRELESNSSSQLVLRRSAETDLSVVRRERDGLERENSRLERQIGEKNDLIKWGKDEVGRKNTEIGQLKTERDDYKNKWVLSEAEVRRINELFNNLQIESNNRDNEISSLREELGNSQNIDLRYKERKLDELIRNSGLNRARVINLRDAYERLMRAREDYNQNNITNANNEIETIRQEFFQTNVRVDDLHKIYKLCEKVAELRVKQERLHEQRYEARQEVPPRNN